MRTSQKKRQPDERLPGIQEEINSQIIYGYGSTPAFIAKALEIHRKAKKEIKIPVRSFHLQQSINPARHAVVSLQRRVIIQ
jgi:hypothetical protein